MGTLVVAEDFGPRGPSGYLEIPDLGGEEKSGRATEGVIEGVTKGRSRQGQPRPRTEVILMQVGLFFKNTFPNGLADPLGMEKLEL